MWNILILSIIFVIVNQSDLLNASVYDLIYDKEQQEVHNLLSNPVTVIDPMKNDLTIGKNVITNAQITSKSISNSNGHVVVGFCFSLCSVYLQKIK